MYMYVYIYIHTYIYIYIERERDYSQEMILEQWVAEADSARQAFFYPSLQSIGDYYTIIYYTKTRLD